VRLLPNRRHAAESIVFLVSGRRLVRGSSRTRSVPEPLGRMRQSFKRMTECGSSKSGRCGYVTCLGLVSRLSYGVDEYVDHLTAGLRADAIEYRVQASGGVRVGVTDDGLGRGGDGQLDASMVL
jgi:hypothetical protein